MADVVEHDEAACEDAPGDADAPTEAPDVETAPDATDLATVVEAEIVEAEIGEPDESPPRERLLASWLGQLTSPRSREAYRAAVEDFERTIGRDVLDVLRDRGTARVLADEYKQALLGRTCAPATINQRLAALRSLVSHAENLGLVDFALTVRGVKTIPLRDLRGPGRPGFAAMLAALDPSTPKGRRDAAILWLAFGCGLRRAEIVGLDVAHLDVDASVVHVQGKGHLERVAVTMAPEVCSAIAAWLELRGRDDGPLFVTLSRARPGEVGGRLSGRDVHRLVAALARRAGIGHVRPHGLRHSAITCALDLGADVRAVQRFSRHADVRTVVRYDDARQDLGGQVGRLVAASVRAPTAAATPLGGPACAPGDETPKAH